MLNKTQKIKIYFALSLFILPVFTYADNFSKTSGLLGSAKDIVNKTLIPLVFSLALLVFFWGVVKYIWSSGDDKNEGKKIMIWGIVALFVMASVWGLVAFIQTELFGSSNPTNITIPTIGGGSSGGAETLDFPNG